MMNCSKNMLRTGALMGAVLLAAYLALPAFRETILGLAPFMVALICPLSMLFAMKLMMPGKTGKKEEEVPVAGAAESAGATRKSP